MTLDELLAWARSLEPHQCNHANRLDLKNPYWDLDDSGHFCRVCDFQVVTDRQAHSPPKRVAV